MTFDSLDYFFYAMDISTMGSFPQNYTPINNGWPIFLSGFFSIFSFEDSISYMELQKIISIILSTITLIPIYYLCKKFVSNSYSLIGAAIFAFEPRIIQNSLLGIADPLYIFLVASIFTLIFDTKEKFSYIAFALSAFATIVRSEGLFLFIAISIIFIIKYRKNRIVIPKYVIASTIFFLLLMPISLYRIDVQGTDGIFFRISNSLNTSLEPPLEINPNWVTPPRSLPDAIITSLENFPKYLIWDLVPLFIFFVPIGIIILFKERNWKKTGVIISLISMSLPAVYAYSLPLQETRYFYFLYPLFCIISIIGLPHIFKKYKNKNKIILLIMIGIVISSSIFMQFKMMDKKHEMEAYEIAKFIVNNTNGVNQYYPEYAYIEAAKIPEYAKDLRAYFFLEREDKVSVRQATLNDIHIISTKGFDSINNFIEFGQKNGLTHIVVDNNEQNKYFNQSTFNEKKYPFLIKVFDSKEKQFKYIVQIYKIDFDKYFELKNTK